MADLPAKQQPANIFNQAFGILSARAGQEKRQLCKAEVKIHILQAVLPISKQSQADRARGANVETADVLMAEL